METHIFVCDICADTQETATVDEYYRDVRKWNLPNGKSICMACVDDVTEELTRRQK